MSSPAKKVPVRRRTTAATSDSAREALVALRAAWWAEGDQGEKRKTEI